MIFYHPKWPVFYEDNHLLVLYKPAGLIMQRSNGNKRNLVDLVKQWLKIKYAKPGNVFAGMVHRLDAPVAGVIAFAKTSKAASRLSEQFRRNRIRKIYLAVVNGFPPKPEGRLEHDIVRKGRFSAIASANQPGAQAARLIYQVVANLGDRTLLKVHLETGRRHQIRLQLAAAGCPILGDVSYGAEQSMQDGRIALLARSLTLFHPTRGMPLTFRSPLPLGWPWPEDSSPANRPYWTMEEFQRQGLQLPP